MAVPPRSTDAASSESAVVGQVHCEVMAYTTRPGRVVFTECGNVDGWIATDLAVDLPE